MHCQFRNFAAIAAFAFLAVACGDSRGEAPWRFDDGEGDASTTQPSSEWRRLEGPYTAGVRFEVDDKLFGYEREDVQFRPDATHVTTNGSDWKPVGDSKLGKLVQHARGIAYAETSSFRYLMRQVLYDESESDDVELFRARQGTNDFTSMGVAPQFDRVPEMFSAGDQVFAYGSLEPGDRSLLRLQDGTENAWREISPPRSAEEGLIEQPAVFHGAVYVSSPKAEGPPRIHAYDLTLDEWSTRALSEDFVSDVAKTLTFGDKLVTLGFSQEADGGGCRTVIRMMQTDGSSEVHTLNTVRPLAEHTLLEHQSALYIVDELGRLLRINPTNWSVERTAAGICPEFRLEGYGLWPAGESLVCAGEDTQILRWKPGQDGWEQVEFGLHRPTDLVVQDGDIHDVRNGVIYTYRDDSGRWAVDVPPVSNLSDISLLGDTRVAIGTKCMVARDGEEWRMFENLVLEESESLGRCFSTNDGFVTSASVVRFRGGFAVGLHGYNIGPSIRFLDPDGSNMAGVQPFHEKFDFVPHRGFLTSFKNSLWVEVPRSNQPRTDVAAFRLDPESGWKRFDPDLVTSNEQPPMFRRATLTTAPTSPKRLWTRVSTVVETDDGPHPVEWRAMWSKSEKQFRLLPPPPPGSFEELQTIKLTNLGALAATDTGVFRWSVDQSKWITVVDELPVPDAHVLDLAADEHRVAVGLERGRIWQYGFETEGG